jgi:nucleoside-diphosphate-sugar epimerase
MFMSQTNQPVVVLGASGFLGRRLLHRLSGTERFRPIAAARRRPADGADVEWRPCDATDPASLAAALAGAAYAINCVNGDAATMQEATRNLCAAAHQAGLRRVIHVSSMAVYGGATGLITETRRLDGSAGGYAAAKVACEAMIQEYSAAGGEAVILRPGCIHGPGSEQWTGRIGRLLRHHRVGDLGAAGDGACNLIHVDDAAEAILAALVRPGAVGQAFNLGDPDPGTWNAYFMRFGRAIGATPITRISARWLKLETKLLAAPLKIATIAAGRGKLHRLAPDPLPDSLARLWQQDIRLDHRRADAVLGFPRTRPPRAIADAAEWFRAQA